MYKLYIELSLIAKNILTIQHDQTDTGNLFVLLLSFILTAVFYILNAFPLKYVNVQVLSKSY